MGSRSFYRVFFSFTESRRHHILKTLANLALIFCGLNPSNARSEMEIENVQQLRLSAQQYLASEYRSADAARVDIKMGGPDMRMRLARCDQPITFNLQDPTNNGGNINVRASCSGTSMWTILVPAQAIVFRPVPVASRNLARGELIADDDITVEILNVSQYRQGYGVKPEDIRGKELKYPVNKGDAFRLSVLDAQMVIKRGDEVSVEALAGTIRVVTTGTAVMNGRIGEHIKVKNNQSARVLSVKVLSAGRVQSIL